MMRPHIIFCVWLLSWSIINLTSDCTWGYHYNVFIHGHGQRMYVLPFGYPWIFPGTFDVFLHFTIATNSDTEYIHHQIPSSTYFCLYRCGNARSHDKCMFIVFEELLNGFAQQLKCFYIPHKQCANVLLSLYPLNTYYFILLFPITAIMVSVKGYLLWFWFALPDDK